MTQKEFENVLAMQDKLVEYIKAVCKEDKTDLEPVCILVAKNFVGASFGTDDYKKFEFTREDLLNKLARLYHVFMYDCEPIEKD